MSESIEWESTNVDANILANKAICSLKFFASALNVLLNSIWQKWSSESTCDERRCSSYHDHINIIKITVQYFIYRHKKKRIFLNLRRCWMFQFYCVTWIYCSMEIANFFIPDFWCDTWKIWFSGVYHKASCSFVSFLRVLIWLFGPLALSEGPVNSSLLVSPFVCNTIF